MKNILSIDFDIIMEPSIQFYNNMTHISWEERSVGNNYVELLTANYMIYQKLTQFLINLTSSVPKEKIHFIFDHHHIINFLDPNEVYVVTNIDHHHDRGYPQKEENDIEKQPLNCGNWVNHVPNLTRYFWIKNYNSIPKINENTEVQGVNIMDFDLNTLSTPDEIYICFSIPWVPPTHHPLLFLWMDILNKIYNTHFDFEQPNS